MTRRAGLAVALLAGLTLAHFDFGWADRWPRVAGLPGGLVWHGAFCVVAAGVYRILAKPGTNPSADPDGSETERET